MSRGAQASSALVIEDNRALAENVRELLGSICDRVLVAPDAEAGLGLAASEGFDLALIDVRLPDGASGIDLVPELRRASPHAEIIVVTGNATVDTAIAAVRHGVFAYVLKPFDSADLLTLAERALEQVALRKERARLSRELERSEALYRGVVDTIDALIVGIDVEARVTLENRFVRAVLGRAGGAFEGRSFLDACFAPEDRARMRRAIERALLGETVRELELELHAQGGAPRVVRWTLKPLSPREASATAVLCLGVDVTERLELERRSVESEAMAAMGVLTTGLAHEIRNPLNAAALQLEALLRAGRKMDDDSAKEQLERRVQIVKGELSRLGSMLQEFLELARARGVKMRPVDVHALLREVVALKQPLAEEAGLSLRVTPAGEACAALADRDKVEQVLLNLVRNAIDAMREQGRGAIELAAGRDGRGAIVVEVIDEGPGFPLELADRIFQPFVTTKPAGTGLGLSIVKKLVAMHGGEVELRAREGAGGTIARFTLPEALTEPAAPR
jgi:PAS domain S-box-containing protein